MPKQDETIDGGRFVDERGHWINSAGLFVDANGKVVEQPVKANQPKPDSTFVPPKAEK